MKIVSVNAGSSTVKLALFEIDRGEEACALRHEVELVGDGTRALLDAAKSFSTPDVVAHRFVHGGPHFTAPLRVDAARRRSLDALAAFSPIHLRSELALLDAATSAWPNAVQVACFDTAFHRDLPDVARRFALPRALFDAGVRRYGFHGLSYEYVVETIGAAKLGRAVIAHLGNGASMTAVRDGRSIDTTMGLTPTGGLVMGTRVGDLDPGVVIALFDRERQGARAVEEQLNRRSGLVGISETTSDMKRLLEASADDPRAALAVDMFCYSARKFVGALVAVLGGVDSLVFTGGIGEHAAPVRERICSDLGFLGIDVDDERNRDGERDIGRQGSACRVLVVATDEERMIARHAFRLLS